MNTAPSTPREAQSNYQLIALDAMNDEYYFKVDGASDDPENLQLAGRRHPCFLDSARDAFERSFEVTVGDGEEGKALPGNNTSASTSLESGGVASASGGVSAQSEAISVSLLRQQQDQIDGLTRELAAERMKCNDLKERLARRSEAAAGDGDESVVFGGSPFEMEDDRKEGRKRMRMG